MEVRDTGDFMDARTDTTETQDASSSRRPAQSEATTADSGGPSSNTAAEVDSRGEKLDAIRHSTMAKPRTDTARHAGALADLLRASRSELDELLTETQKIHERSWHVIQSLLEDLQLRAWQAVDNAVGGVGQEIHDRVGYETSMILENLDVEAEARLAARLDLVLAKSKERQRGIEQDLAVFVADNEKQFAQMSARALEELQQREGCLRLNLQNEAERKLDEVTKSANEITSNIRRLGESLGSELEQRREQAAQVFESRLEQLWEELAGRAEKRIAEIIQTCTSTMAKQAREIVDREMSEFFIQALRHRLDHSPDVRLPVNDRPKKASPGFTSGEEEA